jgi:hypothetical protein
VFRRTDGGAEKIKSKINSEPEASRAAWTGDMSSSHPPDGKLAIFDVVQPHDHDVLCGRGVTTNKWIGNEFFRSLVALNKVCTFLTHLDTIPDSYDSIYNFYATYIETELIVKRLEENPSKRNE